MALNYYKNKLVKKSFSYFKKQPRQQKAFGLLNNLFLN